jgi:hypothetical protein
VSYKKNPIFVEAEISKQLAILDPWTEKECKIVLEFEEKPSILN